MAGDSSSNGASVDEDVVSRAIDAVCKALGGLGALMFAGVATLMVLQASARALRITMIGGDEIAGWLSASAAFCSFAYAFREGTFIRMELLLSRLTGKLLQRAEIGALIIGTLWCATMAFTMARFVWQNAIFGERSTGLISIPIWPVQVPAVVGLVALALAMAEQLVRVWQGQRPIYVVKAERTLAGDGRHSAGV